MAPSATLTPARRVAAVRRRPLRIALGLLAVLLGLGAMALGGLLFTTAHDSHPVEVDGAIADYQAITINGSYARNDLRLAGDAHTYTFDSRQFHPTLPDRFQQDARIRLWVDQGTTNVLALTLYDEMGLNPTAYTTNAYDNPTIAYYSALGEAGVLAGGGFVLLIGGGVAALGRGKRRESRREREHDAPQEAPKGAPRPRGAAGQRVPAVVLPTSEAPFASPPFNTPPVSAAPPGMPPANSPSGPGGMPAAFSPNALPGGIPLGQAAPTTPMPGRPAAPSRPAVPAASVDELPTQKAPTAPAPPAAPPGNAATGGGSPWSAWGVAPEPAPPPGAFPGTLPGTLPDFPTERLPSAGPTPAPSGDTGNTGDIGDQPTRKSETVGPPDPGFGG